MTWIRALFAAGLSLVFPGAGHALLRDWIRAAFFGGLFVMTVALFVPLEALSDAGSFGETVEVLNDLDWIVQFSLSFVLLLAAVDAGFRAMGFPPGEESTTEGPTCPHCGKPLDEDLAFCHWCTTRLEPPADLEENAADDEAGATEDEPEAKPK